jgi:16S rRNA (guanine(966)-N(2))-methyltransferase RsmD
MRIIQGIYKNYSFKPYKGDNTRPTTERVKEQLFDLLANLINFTEINVLDLFAGTGNIGLEFLSRGAVNVTSIDYDKRNQFYIQSVMKELKVSNWTFIKQDALKYIQSLNNDHDVIFADPPYLYAQIHDLHHQLHTIGVNYTKSLIVIIEHPIRVKLKDEMLLFKKEIGDTCLSVYKYH